MLVYLERLFTYLTQYLNSHSFIRFGWFLNKICNLNVLRYGVFSWGWIWFGEKVYLT